MPEPFPISLPAGTKVTKCFTFSQDGSKAPCNNKNLLLNENIGEVQVKYASGTAIFKKPDFNSCIDPREGLCEVEFILPKSSVEILRANSKDFKEYFLIGTPKPKPPGGQSVPNSPPIPNAEHTLPGFVLPISIGLVTLLLVVGLVVKIRKELISPSSTYNKHTSRSTSRQSTNSPQNQFSQFTSTPTTSFDSTKQITFLIQQLQKVTLKLNDLEDDIIGLSQRLQSIEGKTLSPKIDQISPSLNTFIPSVMESPPPAPLSVDLIKKAVASNDYSLISAYPHFFLSETPDSQQGLADGKRFTVDGDQLQASSKTQSEFIAINCKDDTYLIPNIVPNAADPARTLKRHADKNNIYRNGQGGNFLNIDHLAVIQRNGDLFDLKKPGQIN